MPKNKNRRSNYADDGEDVDQFYNSEDEYAEQSGGESSDIEDNQPLDSDATDSSTLDIDPDDEYDPNEDDKYDPINEIEEPIDPDEEINDNDNDEIDSGNDDNFDETTNDKDYVAESKACYLKNLNQDFHIIDSDDSTIYGKLEYRKIDDKNRQTDPILTYYEMVRVIGVRAQQFNFNAPPLIKGTEGMHPAQVAYVELLAGMTPFIVRRHLPNKLYEDWRIDELEMIHFIDDNFFLPENFDWESLLNKRS